MIRALFVFATCALVAAALCSGCTAADSQDQSESAADAVSRESTSSGATEASATFAPGDRVDLSCGISVTVPEGWTGRLLGPNPGDPQFQHLILTRPGTTQHPSSVILYSAVPLGDVARDLAAADPLTSWSHARLYVGGDDFPKPPYRLFAVTTSLPQRPCGLILFGGSSLDPQGSIVETWQLTELTGIAAPESVKVPQP